MSTRRAVTAACLALGLTGLCAWSIGGTASAEDTTTTATSEVATTAPASTVAPVTVATSTFTLPLFGVPLIVDVSTNAGGGLTQVFVNPATGGDGATAVVLRPNKVKFVTTADGQSTVTVGSHHGTQAVVAHTSSLDNIIGKGSWSGDVFATGSTSKVDYEVAKAADGSPDLINVSTDDPNGTVGEVHHVSDDELQGAEVSVDFVTGGRGRTLRIRVGVVTHDGETHAMLAIVLGHERAVAVPLSGVVGDHTWSAKRCDGSDVQIAYTIAADGTLTVPAAPTGATVITKEHGVIVRFGERESVALSTKVDGDSIKVRIEPRFRCGGGAPEVNTSTSIPDTSVPEGDHHGGDGKGDGKGSPAGATSGLKSWDGKLCGGVAAHVEVTLNADGTLTGASATPTATITATQYGFSVVWSDREQLSIGAKLDGSALRFKFEPHVRCEVPTTTPGSSVPVPGGATAGAKAWDGQICSGAAHIGVTLNADGTLSDITATPSATVTKTSFGASVQWSNHEQVSIGAQLHEGVLRFKFEPHIHCDVPPPTTAAPETTAAVTTVAV
jgi:hypothetical protein